MKKNQNQATTGQPMISSAAASKMAEDRIRRSYQKEGFDLEEIVVVTSAKEDGGDNGGKRNSPARNIRGSMSSVIGRRGSAGSMSFWFNKGEGEADAQSSSMAAALAEATAAAEAEIDEDGNEGANSNEQEVPDDENDDENELIANRTNTDTSVANTSNSGGAVGGQQRHYRRQQVELTISPSETATATTSFSSPSQRRLKRHRTRASFYLNPQTRRSQQVLGQGLFYLGAFYMTHLFATTNRLLQLIQGHTYYPLLVMHSFFDPLQGFLNFMVYRRPVYLRHRRIDPTLSRIGAWRKALRFNFQYNADAEQQRRSRVGRSVDASGADGQNRSTTTVSEITTPAMKQTPKSAQTQAGTKANEREEEKREEAASTNAQLQEMESTDNSQSTPYGVSKRVPLKM